MALVAFPKVIAHQSLLTRQFVHTLEQLTFIVDFELWRNQIFLEQVGLFGKTFIFSLSLASPQDTLPFLLLQQWSLAHSCGTSRVTNHPSLPAIVLVLALQVLGKLGQLITIAMAIRHLQLFSFQKCFVNFFNTTLFYRNCCSKEPVRYTLGLSDPLIASSLHDNI